MCVQLIKSGLSCSFLGEATSFGESLVVHLLATFPLLVEVFGIILVLGVVIVRVIFAFLLADLHVGYTSGLHNGVCQYECCFLIKVLVLVKFLAKEGLNLLKDLDIILGDDGDCSSGTSCSSCPTNSVDIVLAVCWDVKVDDQINVWDIESS